MVFVFLAWIFEVAAGYFSDMLSRHWISVNFTTCKDYTVPKHQKRKYPCLINRKNEQKEGPFLFDDDFLIFYTL